MSLELTNIRLTYPDGDGARITAVDDVSLAVPRGRLVGLTGPSGCGKSSVLSVSGLLIAPDGGRAAVDGIDATDLAEEERAAVRRTRLGFVFQHDNLLPSLTALEQVLLPVHLAGRRPAAEKARARELLADVGLADATDRKPHQLSGGMRQRVNIARALINRPSVLLADEPTSALDSHRAADTMALLTGLVRERDVAALLVTHDARALAEADQTVTMLDGAVVDSGVTARV